MNIAIAERATDTRTPDTIGNADRFIARYQTLRTTLSDHAARDAACDWLVRNGLPRRSVEAWKYTDLRRLWDREQSNVESPDHTRAARDLSVLIESCGLDPLCPRLVFAGGKMADSLSILPQGFQSNGFAGVSHAEAPDHPILALNTMLATDGMTLHVPADHDAGHLLLVTLGNGAEIAHLRHRVVLETGASLTLIEIAAGEGNYVNDAVTDITVGEKASLRHVRIQQDGKDAVSLSHVRVTVAARGAYDGFNLALGSALARHEVRARLEGDHGIVHVNGAQLLSGTQIADLTSAIMHAAPHCSSRQTVKNVLAGRSRGVFQGKIVVDRIAQKTDGYQMNQALLLSEEAEIDTKPELEIFADDVKCSHGATAGALDEDQLFYLRSRGIPEAEARQILVRAFLDDALGLVSDQVARTVLEHAMDRWWAGQA